MKRRFAECAVLLGIMVSITFLANAQNGAALPPCPGYAIGVSDQDTASGSCGGGLTWEVSWASYTYGGRPSLTGDCQTVYTLRVSANAFTGKAGCGGGVWPSISEGLGAIAYEPGFAQGRGTIKLRFSNVCYHKVGPHHGSWMSSLGCPTCNYGFHCKLENEGEKTASAVDVEISLKIVQASTTLTEIEKFSVTYTGIEGGSGSAEYSKSESETINDYKAIGYGIYINISDNTDSFLRDLGTWWNKLGNPVVFKQSKEAKAWGYAENAQVSEANAATSNYKGIDEHECSPYNVCNSGCPIKM